MQKPSVALFPPLYTGIDKLPKWRGGLQLQDSYGVAFDTALIDVIPGQLISVCLLWRSCLACNTVPGNW